MEWSSCRTSGWRGWLRALVQNSSEPGTMPPLAIQELFSLPASAKVDSILATVPDPLHSRLALFTDGSLDAIEATVGAAGWVFAAQCIPWRDPIDEGAKDPSARRKQRY